MNENALSEKQIAVIQFLKDHNLEKEAITGIMLMLQQEEAMDLFIEYLVDHMDEGIDQCNVLRKVVDIVNEFEDYES